MPFDRKKCKVCQIGRLKRLKTGTQATDRSGKKIKIIPAKGRKTFQCGHCKIIMQVTDNMQVTDKRKTNR